MERIFDTPGAVELYVELGRGSLTVTAVDTDRSTLSASGEDAESIVTEQHGDQISVIVPRHRSGSLSGNEPHTDVAIEIPSGSILITKTGSAEQLASGSYADVAIRSGSDDLRIEHITGTAVITTGSGDIWVGTYGGDLRIKSGSGDVQISHAAGTAGVSTGSGDIVFAETDDAVMVKSGSGDVGIRRASGDISANTASGDVAIGELRRGSLSSKNASGDVHIGVPSGVPVWTDVSSVTGNITSDLAGAGQPGDDQDHIEIRAVTVSGDIVLKQL